MTLFKQTDCYLPLHTYVGHTPAKTKRCHLADAAHVVDERTCVSRVEVKSKLSGVKTQSEARVLPLL